MKKMKKIYWMLFIILCAACNDPYDGDTYVVLPQLIYPADRKTFPNGFTL